MLQTLAGHVIVEDSHTVRDHRAVHRFVVKIYRIATSLGMARCSGCAWRLLQAIRPCIGEG